MGENRPTAMRGEGMENVIFAGLHRRPARGQVEATLAIGNRARLSSASFNRADTLEVTWRIALRAGSVYRISGRELRARNVQMLFADAPGRSRRRWRGRDKFPNPSTSDPTSGGAF